MGRKCLGLVCVFCLFLMGFVGTGSFGSGASRGLVYAADEVWPVDWTDVTDPVSLFNMGNIGTWSNNGTSYEGKGSNSLSSIYSYSTLGMYDNSAHAISSMTNYKVRMSIIRPSSTLSPYYPKIIIGAKSSGAVISSSSLQIDFMNYGIDINQFGNLKWNNGNKGVSYPLSITALKPFSLEVSVTPEVIELLIDGVSIYKLVDSTSGGPTYDEVGLFGVGGTGVTAAKGVSFGSIQYKILDMPVVPVPLGLQLTSACANNFSAKVTGLSAGDRFQVWTLVKSRGEGVTTATYWVLVKGFLDFTNVFIDGNGASVFTYDIPEASMTIDGRYTINIRVMGSLGEIIWHDTSSIATISGSIAFNQILVDEKKVEDSYFLECDRTAKTVSIRADVSGSLIPGDMLYYQFMRSGITAIGDTDTPLGWFNLQNSSSSTCLLTIPATGALYNIRVKVYTLLNPTQNFTFKDFKLVVTASDTPGMIITDVSIGNKPSMEVGDYFSLNLFGKTSYIGTGVNPKYKFVAGEPWKTPLFTQNYSSNSIFSERITAPGVYLVQSYVSHGAYSAYDDGLLQYSTVTRKPAAIGLYNIDGNEDVSISKGGEVYKRVNSGGIFAGRVSSSVSSSVNSVVGSGIDAKAMYSGLSASSISGSAQFYSCAVRINGDLTPLSANELSYSTSPLYPDAPSQGDSSQGDGGVGTLQALSSDSPLDTSSESPLAPASSSSSPTLLAAGDVVDFDAVGTGLFTGSSLSLVSLPSSEYQYSFYRLDVNGYREVKSWSNDGTLSWKPFAPGSYSIAVRVRGSDAMSYEQQRIFHFNVGGVLSVDDLAFSTDKQSYVDANTISPALARKPVVITALATGAGTYVYRFEVCDAFLGNITLRGFSSNPQVTWIPRKAGVYRIVVRAQDVSSCGFGDRVVTGEDFVVG